MATAGLRLPYERADLIFAASKSRMVPIDAAGPRQMLCRVQSRVAPR